MELALRSDLPTYSGGLGVLAGDTIRSIADLKIPAVAVSLLYRKGYFHQRLDAQGVQREEPAVWAVEQALKEESPRVSVTIEGRPVALRAWRYDVPGIHGVAVPVYLLDAELSENAEPDRALTHTLYGGDPRYRLCQEVILGIGGVRMLRALGYEHINRFHLNEGHASLLTLELLDEQAKQAGRESFTDEDVEAVRQQCVFTTHTPVPAGHDKFPMELVTQLLGSRKEFQTRAELFCCDGLLNMTYLALNLSHYVNGVAKKHGAVSQEMFANYHIEAITNGIHAATWAAEPFQALFDRYISGWKEDNFSLRHALMIPPAEIWDAHLHAKQRLIEEVNRRTNAGMQAETLTLGFARRATPYKRADLLFRDLKRLKSITGKGGVLQIIYAGKAHPQDEEGKKLIQRIFEAKGAVAPHLKVAYLEDYDMTLGQLLTSGVDVWLNTPQPPLEASGTSGMKAALNGVPSLSVLDGWWIEGCIENVTGWAIDGSTSDVPGPRDDAKDAEALYEKLKAVIALFYNHRHQFIDIMRHAIALNGSFFNTQRMVREYVVDAYFLS